jgi:hypothetical protein
MTNHDLLYKTPRNAANALRSGDRQRCSSVAAVAVLLRSDLEIY